MKRIAVFPGSFDPFTLGHEDIVKRALPLFDKVIVAIGVNTSKKYHFSLELRMEWIGKVFAGKEKVSVQKYEGLTVDFCRANDSRYILRGLRSNVDFEFEKPIAHMNTAVANEIETVFLVTSPELSGISSTIVRDIIKNGGNASQFLPKQFEI
jgi:pantetheine-phosphate adenylyltransferase